MGEPRDLTRVEVELDELTTMVGARVLEAYLDQFGVPIDLQRLVRAAVVTGMDVGIAFATGHPDEARIVEAHVERGAGLTEADTAQRSLTFQGLVAAARNAGT